MVPSHGVTRGRSFAAEVVIGHTVATVAAAMVLFSGEENNLNHDETPLC